MKKNIIKFIIAFLNNLFIINNDMQKNGAKGGK